MDVTLASLDKQTRAVKVLDSGYAFVTAPSGLLVSFPARKGWAGKKTLKVTRPAKSKDPANGRDVVIFTAPVKTGGWAFAAVVPEDEINASVLDLRNKLLLIGLAALLAHRRRARARRAPDSPSRARGGRGPPSGSRRAIWK